ncbi:hypothetical protein LZ92_24435 [Salmonella enterica]|nr:hypothetical protein [Salmonella enterica]
MRKLRFCYSGTDALTLGSNGGSQCQGAFTKSAVLCVSLRRARSVHSEHGYLRRFAALWDIHRPPRLAEQRLHRVKTAVRWSVVTGMTKGVLVQQQ